MPTPTVLPDFALVSIRFAVNRLIRSSTFPQSEREDLEQELALEVMERLPRFDPGRAACTTFVQRCIEHRIANLIRNRCRARRHPRRAYRIADGDGDRRGTVSAAALTEGKSARERERSDLRCDLLAAIAALPPRLRAICVLLPTESPYAISRRLGLSKRAIYRDVEAIRAAFAAAGLADYRS